MAKVKGRKIARATSNLLNIVDIMNQAERRELGKMKNIQEGCFYRSFPSIS